MELLIVIVVIGILAAITIVAYSGISERARVASVSSALSQVSKKLALYSVDNGTYPDDLITAGVKDSASVSYQYTVNKSVTPQTFCITATTATTSYSVNQNSSPTSGGCAGHSVGGRLAITNLVANPSFETGLGRWNLALRSTDTAIRSTSQALTGTAALALTTSSAALDTYVEYMITLQPGTYSVSGYVYLGANGPTYTDRDSMFYRASGLSAYPGIITYDRSKVGQWQRTSATFTTTTAGILGVRFYSPVGTSYVDDVMITQTDTVYPYADGSLSNWIWNGPSHDATSTGPAL